MKLMNHHEFGYVVMRLPAFVGEWFGDKPHVLSGVQQSSVSYNGIDRDPWWDLGELYYSGSLDERQQRVFRQLRASKLRSFSPGICFDLEAAKEMLVLSNQTLVRNELILVATQNEKPQLAEKSIVLGLDCYIDGCGSLLRLGIFRKPELFEDFIELLNSNGMFDGINNLSMYMDAYVQRCHEGDLEPVSTNSFEHGIFSASRVLVT